MSILSCPLSFNLMGKEGIKRSLFVLMALTLLLATAPPILGQAGEAGFKVVDFQGSHPLSGARVVAVNTVDPSERLEATADQSGFVRIEGIKADANYTVEVYWRSPSYKQESELVFKRGLRGSDILEIGEVRVNVFTVKLVALDGSGGPLDWISGVEEGERQMGIILDGVDLEDLEVPLAATADLVPQGEHELKVIWDGYTVYDGSIYVGLEDLTGYIPGLDDPERYRENLERLRIAVKTKTAGLTIQIYYPDGRRVEEAGVDIIDVNGVIKKIGFGVRAIKGADTWGDLPTTTKFKVILYWHYSQPPEKLAEVTCVPGAEPCEIRLRPEQGPFYTVRVRARYPYGGPRRGRS